MLSKLGKYFSLLLIFMFIMTLTAEAFTAIRPEQLKDMGGKPPMTRAQRKARQREEQEQREEFTEPTPEPTFVHEENNNNNGGASDSGSGDFVRPSETPTPEPTVDNDQIEREKRLKARKTTSLVTIIMFLLIVGGVVGWYCTRNVNFKKLKK